MGDYLAPTPPDDTDSSDEAASRYGFRNGLYDLAPNPHLPDARLAAYTEGHAAGAALLVMAGGHWTRLAEQ